MTGEEAVTALEGLGDPLKAAQMEAYHKAPRRYLGVSNPVIEHAVRRWRTAVAPADWADLAIELWNSDVHEAMIAAGKLLDLERFPSSDEAAWEALCEWVESFDAWAVADHAMIAGQKRLVAQPERIETVATWTTHPNMWTRRAALVITLPYAKVSTPDAVEERIRQRVLAWAAVYVDDQEWFIQKAVAWWLRELSKVDSAVTREFVSTHDSAMRGFARREATKYL
jgi:3-methyladenine DNA glycosylase AlkD